MFESLKLDFLLSLQEKIDARIMRERVLILLTLLALIFMLWNFAVQSSIDKKSHEAAESLANLVSQRAALQSQIAAATQSLLNDPDKPKKEQIEQLEKDVQGLETQLQSVSQNLIRAEQLPQALQEVLQKSQSLTLLEVKTLPAKELQLVDAASASPSAAQAPTEGEPTVGVYQHVVELRVSGSYSQMLHFLMELEQLPWRFYWQSLDYSVDKYPNAEAVLRVYTLSSEEGLFGV
ncbi:MSHA biogenesis protein MshJ [Cellvibrio sp.]|uniref:MSHA biogenesis protein MshJ n=1 Tax=Cellvibrio sp. TaxID=1965322 RepID=UPI003964807C